MNALAGGQTVQIYSFSRKPLAETALSTVSFPQCISRTASSRCSSSIARLAVLPLPGGALQEVRRQPRNSGSATCRSRFNVDGDASIWIHAVSVGETLTAKALIADLREQYPRLRLFLSTTTIAGQQVARKNLQQVDEVFYFPFDWSFTVRRTLNIVKPRMFVMMETEIWPNLLRECRAQRDQDGRDQRADLGAFVSPVSPGAAAVPQGAGRRGPLLHAERRVGAPHHRPRCGPGACRR